MFESSRGTISSTSRRHSQGNRTRAIDDAVRTRAQAFVSQGKAVYLALSQDSPSLLLAASPDSGVHAGERVKAAVTALGGRDGGNQTLAQGSLPASVVTWKPSARLSDVEERMGGGPLRPPRPAGRPPKRSRTSRRTSPALCGAGSRYGLWRGARKSRRHHPGRC